MAFIESRPLDSIDYSSEGGPMFRTDVVEFESGHEQRNQIWTVARRRYTINNLMLGAEADTVMNAFMGARGQLNGFRFKDWGDYRTGSNYSSVTSTDSSIGTGDGVTTVFQIIKDYTFGTETYQRKLNKIVSSTTVVSLTSSVQREMIAGSEFSVDLNTGVLTFTSAPATSTVIKCGCEFDVPVRFDSDSVSLVHAFYHGADTSLDLIELRVSSVVL